MSRPIVKGAVDQSTVIRIVDSGDGTPETGVTSATGGLDLKYRRALSATVNLTESDLSALTDAHADGGMLHIGAGYYRIDVPDAAFATGADHVLIFGTVTGMVVIGAMHELVEAKIPALVGGRVDSSVGAMAAGVMTTTAFADGAMTAAKFASGAFDAVWTVAARSLTTFGSLVSDVATAVWGAATRLLTAGTNIVLAKGTGITGFNDLSAAQVNSEADAAIETYHLDHLLATTYDPASKPGAADALFNELVESDGGVARFTANALEEGPTGGSAPTAGEVADEVRVELATELGRLDVAVSTRATPAQVATELGTYDAPTKAEFDAAVALLATAAALTTVDTVVDAIKAKTDSLTFAAGGLVANVTHINETEVIGTGVLGDKWRPAP